MTKLRVGLVGLGEVAQVIHLPVLASLPDLFDVRAVCDISPSLLQVARDRFGIAGCYQSSTEMLAHEELDCVLVLNSDEYHADCVVEALENGLDVLVEKPMCLSPREADAIIKARDRAGKTVMVGYMRRFAPAFLQAKEKLASLGKVNYVRVHDIIGQNQLIVDQTSLVARPTDIPADVAAERSRRGGELVREAVGAVPDELAGAYRLLCGLGSHDLSAMRELLGKPKSVIAAHRSAGTGFITALLEYDGFVATYETGVDAQLRFDAHIEVYGDSATMRVQYDTPYVRHLPTRLFVDETAGDEYRQTASRPHLKDPYTAELEYFHHVVTNGLTPKTTPEDFVEDLELFAEIIRVLDKA
jgi:predicted dehydrogenase